MFPKIKYEKVPFLTKKLIIPIGTVKMFFDGNQKDFMVYRTLIDKKWNGIEEALTLRFNFKPDGNKHNIKFIIETEEDFSLDYAGGEFQETFSLEHENFLLMFGVEGDFGGFYKNGIYEYKGVYEFDGIIIEEEKEIPMKYGFDIDVFSNCGERNFDFAITWTRDTKNEIALWYSTDPYSNRIE
ncbi:hypothetical protein [Miniphocaeibacter massiliensis]|uniref:hypothetical protein n=1 Tax=Miniphocaeibacter massiliensis TaxID=2041841 RepID=UPI000C1C3BA8|nr:hypothetical protein [Miniphocaeibacter massiliensis]